MLGATVGGVALFRSDLLAKRESPFLIRPPGARENNPDVVSLTRCTRCNECVRACPTGSLRPAFMEAGLAGVGTPLLAPRQGGCAIHQSCPDLCAQVCPTGALKPKRTWMLEQGKTMDDIIEATRMQRRRKKKELDDPQS